MAGRVRRRRALLGRLDWPTTPEEEYARGPDLERYTSRLAAFFARRARDVDDIREARDIERQWRLHHPVAP